MRICLVVTPSLFEPQRRVTQTLTLEDGALLSDVIPGGVDPACCLAWVNGSRVEGFDDHVLHDEDLVQVVVAPGLLGLDIPLWLNILLSAALLVVPSLLVRYLAGNLDSPVEDPDGSANNGFAGFRNSYESGSVAPVVYGRHRVAAPCINQEIGAAGGTIQLTQVEALQALYAVSEGPIYGFGKLLGVAGTQEEVNTLSLIGGSVVDNMQLQINGQEASNFAGVSVNWRTGEDTQERIPGYSSTTQTSTIEQSLEFISGITAADIPSGVYSAGSDIQSVTAGDSVSFQTDDQYDRARIQFLFERGLFKASAGTPIPSEARFRVQYYATDSVGTRIDDTVVLPEITVGGVLQTSAVYDLEFPLFAASGYTGPQQLGYYAVEKVSIVDRRIRLLAPLNAAVLPDGFASPDLLGFTFAAWIRLDAFTPNTPNHPIFTHWGGTSNGYASTFPFSIETTTANFGFSFRLVSTVFGWILILESSAAGTAQRNQWRSSTFGGTSSFAFWAHVGFVYQENLFGNPTVTIHYNGVELGVTLTAYSASANGYFSTDVNIEIGGGVATGLNTADEERHAFDICSAGLYQGYKPPSFFEEKFSSQIDTYGFKDGAVIAGEQDLRAGFNIMSLVATNKIPNLASGFESSTTSGECFQVTDVSTFVAAPSNEVPLFTTETGSQVQSYYKIQVFRSNEVKDDPTDEQNDASVEQITMYLDEDFEHPQMALLDVRVVADDQVNNQRPTITTLVLGKKCPVWDGISTEFPSFTNAWTRNPAWIALDMLSNTRYGMGNIFPLSTAFDLPAWLAWANFCDEGVEDGFGAQTFYGGTVTMGHGPSSANGTVRFNVPLLVSAGNPTGNSIPSSWIIGSTLGIKSADSASQPSLAGGWVTTPLGGTLEITQIAYKEDDTAPDGYTFWVEIDCNWTSVVPLPTTANSDVTGVVVGFEPRCMFDGVFDEKNADAWDQVIQVFQAGHAMPVLVGSKISVFVDRLRPPVGMVTMANCIEGSFELDWVDSKDLANSFEVDFLDELANYERVTIQVDHDSAQDEASFEDVRKARVAFRGVVRRSQAVRDAMFRLNQQNDLRRRCKFQLGLDGIPLLPGDRIQVAHDTPKYGISGRLLGAGEGSGGNLNIYPETFADNLVEFGGMLDVSDAMLEVAGVPTFTTSSPGYKITGPLGFGSAELIRNTTIGVGEDDPSTGNAATAGVATSLEFYATGLLPPTPAPSFLATVNDTNWQVTASVFVKEPPIAGSDTCKLTIHFAVDQTGSVLDESFEAYFKWTAGVLAVNGTPTNGATATVQDPGTTGASAGWYRAAIHMRYSDLPGTSNVSVGDPYQVLFSPATQGSMAAGEFIPAAIGGKGVNFIPNGDPLNLFSGWTATNASAVQLTVAEPPPFYADVDHGAVWHATVNFSTSDGTTARWRHITTIDGFNTTFGNNGVVANQDFTVSMYLKNVDATITRVEIANTVSGQYCRANINWSGPSVSFTTTNGGDATLTQVVQNSTSVDADWYRFDVTFRNAGGDQQYNVDIYPQYAASSAATKGVYVWGIRSHGVSSNGSRVNPYPHVGMYAWGMEVTPSYTIADYNAGGSLALDRDFTFVSGNDYEIEVRSSTAQNAGGGPIVEVVQVDPQEVPGAVSAGTFISTTSSFKSFTPARGDIYSIGTSGTTTRSFAVVSIDLDPETLVRSVTAVEYADSVYDEPDDLPGVSSALATFKSGDVPLAGSGGGSAIPVQAFYGAPPTLVESTNYTADGEVEYAVNATWSFRRYEQASQIGGVRLYVAEKESSTAYGARAPMLVADVPRRIRTYNIRSYPWSPGTSYRVYFQPYSTSGNAKPVASCTFAELTFYGGVPRPTSLARVSSNSVRGERALITIRSANSDDPLTPSSFEARVGGWRLGQRLTNLVRGEGDMTDELLNGPINLAGEGAPPIIVRGRLGRGCVGRPTETRMAGDLTGRTVLADVAVEDDFTEGGAAILSGLTIVSPSHADRYIRFAATGTTAPAYWQSAVRDFTYPRRVYVQAWAEASLTPSQTLGDFDGVALGSPRMMHWTLEGPVSGPEHDGTSLSIHWVHNDDGSALGTDYVPFRPGVVFMQRCCFRVVVEREKDPDVQMRIRRIGIRIIELPSYRADGGTF